MGTCCSSAAPEGENGGGRQDAPIPRNQTTNSHHQQQQGGRQTNGRNGQAAGGAERQAASFAASVVGWDKDFPAMTLSQLQSKRLEFWDTRVQGRAECWQAIRVAVESGDEATSGVILESAEMTPFDCERADMCFTYDAKGFKYEVPLYCLYLPSNLQRDSSPPANSQNNGSNKPNQPLHVQPAKPAASSSRPQSAAANNAQGGEAGSGGVTEDESKQQVVSERVSSGKALKFKIRFSNGLADLSIEQRTSCNIGQLKSLIVAKHSHIQLDRIRIYYLGKYMANDKWNLGDIGMKKEMVLQAFIPPVLKAE